MATILEVKNVTKDFVPPFSLFKIFTPNFGRPQPTRALENVSFTLNKGSILSILGPNGAGKTTLLKIISTLILPDKGSVTLERLSLGQDDNRIKASVGLAASSERSFYWRLTGRQNLQFFAAMYGLDKHKSASRIDELLKLFEITYQDKRFDSYSTGMQQKFALMRALIHDPMLLLLDEPTKSLDYASSLELKAFIKEVLVKKYAKTIIFTTHHMDEALDFAEVFMILHEGKVFAFGTLDDLRAKAGAKNASLGEVFIRLTKDPRPC